MSDLTTKYGSSAITEAQAAQELSVSVEDIQSMIKLRELKAAMLNGGKIVRIPISEIDRLLGNDLGGGIQEQRTDLNTEPNVSCQVANNPNESYYLANCLYLDGLEDLEDDDMAVVGTSAESIRGSVFYSEARQEWRAQFPIEVDGVKKRKLLTGFKNEKEARRQMILAQMCAQGKIQIPDYEASRNLVSVVPEPAKEKHLFLDVVDKWFKVKQLKNTENSMQKYIYAKKHIDSYFAGMYIQDMEDTDISDYYMEKRAGDVDNARNPLSLRTLKDHRELINGTFKYAMKKKMIDSNPTEDIDLPKDKSNDLSYFTEEELNAVLEKIDGNSIESAVVLTASYGLRRQEVLGLKWSAIDFDDKTLTINHTATLVGKNTVRADRTKTDSSWRTFPLTDKVVEYLLGLKAQQEAQKKAQGASYYDSDYICRWDNGKLPYPCTVTRYWREFLQDNGYKHITFHDLRHSSASLLLKLGFTLPEIKDWLGHADINSTMIYAHLDPSNKGKMTDKVSQTLRLPKKNAPNCA